MEQIKCKMIDFQSPEYNETVELRRRILRKPLGIDFSEDQLAKEGSDIHLGLYLHNVLVACLILTPEPEGKIKMRQVAVDAEFQGKGIGKKMIAFAEQWASDNNYTYMHCNARKTAVPFYLQSKYIIVGDTFLEVNIPHLYMYKKLS
jgi:GNAT superfamily N-acetyltransferase